MVMNMTKDKKEDAEKWNKMKCMWFSIRYYRFIRSNGLGIDKKIEWLELKNLSRYIYGEQFTILVHLIHMGVKT
jgi:hypothetical protein